jgi:hypothetical protein
MSQPAKRASLLLPNAPHQTAPFNSHTVLNKLYSPFSLIRNSLSSPTIRWGDRFLQNLGPHLPHYTASHRKRPQVPDKPDIVSIRMVAINVLNNQLLTAERGWFFAQSLCYHIQYRTSVLGGYIALFMIRTDDGLLWAR